MTTVAKEIAIETQSWYEINGAVMVKSFTTINTSKIDNDPALFLRKMIRLRNINSRVVGYGIPYGVAVHGVDIPIVYINGSRYSFVSSYMVTALGNHSRVRAASDFLWWQYSSEVGIFNRLYGKTGSELYGEVKVMTAIIYEDIINDAHA